MFLGFLQFFIGDINLAGQSGSLYPGHAILHTIVVVVIVLFLAY
jgi:hypothetical protein